MWLNLASSRRATAAHPPIKMHVVGIVTSHQNNKACSDAQADSTNMTGRLIELVQEHPALWDKSLKDYKDIILKENIWMDIAREFNDDGECVFKCTNISRYLCS